MSTEFGTASFEEVKELANSIYHLREDNVDEVIKMYTENVNFHNGYNIGQLNDMLRIYTFDKVINDKPLIKFITKLKEKCGEDISGSLLTYLNFPIDCSYIVRIPDNNESKQETYDSNGFTIYEVKKNTIIEAYNNNGDHIMTLTINGVPKFSKIDISLHDDGCFDLSGVHNVSAVFNDVSNFHFETNFELMRNQTEIAKIIMSDDVDKLIEYDATNPKYLICKNFDIFNFHFFNGSPYNRSFNTNPIYLSMLSGAVKCFKFLYLNGRYETPTTYGDKCAIFGGNIEIFRILFNDAKFTDSEQIFKHIISTHNDELFDFWLLNNELNSKKIIEIVEHSLSRFNYTAFEKLINIPAVDDCLHNKKFTNVGKIKMMLLPGKHFEAILKANIKLNYLNGSLCDEHFKYILNHENINEFIDYMPEDNITIIEDQIRHNRSVDLIKLVINKLYPDGIDDFVYRQLFKICLARANRHMDILEYLKELIPKHIIKEEGKHVKTYMLDNMWLVHINLDVLDYILNITSSDCSDDYYLEYAHEYKAFYESPEFMEYIDFIIKHGADPDKVNEFLESIM